MTADPRDPRLDRLEDDCRALRRTNARWRRATTAVIAAAGALVFMGQGGAAQKVVRAEKLELVKGGKLRALLAVDDSDQVSLSLLDPATKVRALFSVKGDGSATFSFVDADGSVRATFSQARNGKPGLALLQADGTKRLSLTAEPSGVLVSDEAGKTKAALLCKGAGKGLLQLRNADGKAIFSK